MNDPLAHSARGRTKAQLYADHIEGVVDAAVANATAATGPGHEASAFVGAVRAAAEVHDLGKLNLDNQEVLRRSSKEALPVKHEDAGIAYLLDQSQDLSACLVAAHHAGLYEWSLEQRQQFEQDIPALRIPDAFENSQTYLTTYVAEHVRVRPGRLANWPSYPMQTGFGLRVALSCLVDADHGDTARNYGQEVAVMPPDPRWEERIANLELYIKRFGAPQNQRDVLRGEFFRACAEADPLPPWRACDAPVGSGKTLAVMAHLLRAAQAKQLRHILVVLPYTNIIRQSVQIYRDALTLEGEHELDVVAEHHHQADFASAENRHLATLWGAPITVTTAVQFFETLASHHPSKLRKLHALPNSAVFLDETHSCLPPHLWRVTWGWLRDWVEKWNGHIVLASGSLPSFWTSTEFVEETSIDIPNLVPEGVRSAMATLERARLLPQRHPEALSLDGLINFTRSKAGPHLVILNTIHSAATLAKAMSDRGMDVLHLSTALAPKDRDPVLDLVGGRLAAEHDRDWTLVATSCVEAGVDLSFRTAVRECASLTSLIQTGGRVRRHQENWKGELWSVRLSDESFKSHPGLRRSADVLDELLDEEAFERLDPNELILTAWRRELKSGQLETSKALITAEEAHNHQTLSRNYKVIDSDTALVVVDQGLVERLRGGDKVSPIDLTRGSVQIWTNRLQSLPVESLMVPGRKRDREIYAWTGTYDPDFLGYMAGAFESEEFFRNGGAVV